MRGLYFLYPALLLGTAIIDGAEAATKKSIDSVLLSKVKTLTLRHNLKTSHRRVSAIPQLKCVGGTAKGLYEVDVMRCKNQGSDYDDENIQWTCTASLPPEFKLGTTEVICEGYDSPDDPHVLKGSCGVEYRLVLTRAGEEKYGGGTGDLWRDFKRKGRADWSAIMFWFVFVGIVGWMVYSAFLRRRGLGLGPLGGNPPWGGGGGDGGGGGGGGDEPPPPYDYHPPRKPTSSSSSSSSAWGTRRVNPAGRAGQQGWRPGFWTGALGGAAAGYLAGNRGQTQQPRNTNLRGTQTGGWFGRSGGGAGASGGRGRDAGGSGSSGSSSSASPSTSRYESTGFGSTSRR